TFLIGGTVVALGLGGFYMAMLRSKQKQQEAGLNPYYERVMGYVNQKPVQDEILRPLPSHYSDIPPHFPTKEHHSGHVTVADYKNSPQYAEQGETIRHMVPPPQRAGPDGTRPYTKSPDYVSNYGKTIRPGHAGKEAEASRY
ncbi:hypothetical protein BDZ97DRAFT_1659345, partial [Flammula alnicola]